MPPRRLLGRVETPWHESALLKGNLPGDPHERMIPVYLPPGYDDDDPSRRYPVVVILAGHGGSGPLLLSNVDAWTESFPERIDRLIGDGNMGPVIAVLPDCFTIFGGAQYLNSSALGPYEEYLVQEVLPFVDARYRTLPDRRHRAIAGKSSGGYGAIVQAMRHPELFSAVAVHSGDMYFEFGYLPDMARLHQDLLRHGGLEGLIAQIATIKPKSHTPFWAVMGMLCYGAAFAPNPDAPRGFDMPIDMEIGTLREDVWARWLAWDPVRMVDEPRYSEALRSYRYVYLDCGLWDELNFAIGHRLLSKKLRGHGIAHDFELFPDGHINVPYRYDVSLPRLERAIRA
ncbi:MAG: esterase [Chloroflexi bacterium]|nr:esterase [Chloroflexota bacterium]